MSTRSTGRAALDARLAGWVRGIARRLPAPMRVGLERSHQQFRGLISRREIEREAEPQELDGGLPLPPKRLRRLVAGFDGTDEWLRGGQVDAGLIRGLVEAHDRPLSEMGAILDFGCGCGRVARWWADLSGPQFGCDYDGTLTEWSKANLPLLRVKTNASEPPLPFKSEMFDLIYAISLFTHLTSEVGDRWMKEVHRVLKPGGLLLFTVHGERFSSHLTPEQHGAFCQGELVVRYPELNGMEACAAFHPPEYVRGRLLSAAGLEFVDSVQEDRTGQLQLSPMALQDNYLARKPSAT